MQYKLKHRLSAALMAGAMCCTMIPAASADEIATPETADTAVPEVTDSAAPDISQITENLYNDLPDAPTGSYLGSMGLPVATGETKISISAWVSDLYDGADAHIDADALNEDETTITIGKNLDSRVLPVVEEGKVGVGLYKLDRDTCDLTDEKPYADGCKTRASLLNGSSNRADIPADAKMVAGAVYELYTADDIYSISGELLAAADTLLGTATTDENGLAYFDVDVPLRGEHYGSSDAHDWTTNSGRYYLREVSVPDGYLIEQSVIPVEFTYENQFIACKTASILFISSILKGKNSLQNEQILSLFIEISFCYASLVFRVSALSALQPPSVYLHKTFLRHRLRAQPLNAERFPISQSFSLWFLYPSRHVLLRHP